MSFDVAANNSGVAHLASIPTQFRRHMQLSARAFAVAFCAVTMTGCDHAGRLPTRSSTSGTYISPGAGSRTTIPLPQRALLNPQPEPGCEFKSTQAEAVDPSKLDYERQCYRHAEMIVRSRLHLLQGSVDKTIKAVKRNERSGS